MIGFVQNGVKRGGMTNNTMKLLSILTLSILMTGCATCKKGQVTMNGECLYPGHVYETSLNGDVIRD